MADGLYEAAEKFVGWLDSQVTEAARGGNTHRLEVDPRGSFWLGRLAPEESVVERGLGERGERLDPCAMGLRLLTKDRAPWQFSAIVEARAWLHSGGDEWVKSSLARAQVQVTIESGQAGGYEFGGEELSGALTQVCGTAGLSAAVCVDVRPSTDGQTELGITVVNKAAVEAAELKDTNIYEVAMEVDGLETVPFILESLPDSFRYDRRLEAYGVNCGVERVGATRFRTTDTVVAHRGRSEYWNVDSQEPDMRFSVLASDPVPPLEHLVNELTRWGNRSWSTDALDARAEAEGWSEGMRSQAGRESGYFYVELERLKRGLNLLREQGELLRAFKLMNEAIAFSAHGKYDRWRPFQVAFLLANLSALVDSEGEAPTAEVIWFATGGGKTETYLGLLITAALLDRIQGKATGITAWSRFPLRMLSLQQTQRFADAMAGAEMVRRQEQLPGDVFSVGFLVGRNGTPNRIPQEPQHQGDPDPEDDDMPGQYQVLTTCPFCHDDSVEMAFDRLTWCLEHRCGNASCPWEERRLPFFIVDDEIFRFLPTVIVGTLDKAAMIAIQASMRGFVGPPHGTCSKDGHGFTYAPRSERPHGCLVPGCPGTSRPLLGNGGDYGPRFRLQDELHLLKDSLGAVDAHYESLFDHLQEELTGVQPKILASSATLTGYEHQVGVLYNREARVFPVPGPSPTQSFWTRESTSLARRFVAMAPRGQTLEFTIDQLLTTVQKAIRRLAEEPVQVCQEIGIDECHAADLLSLYGTNVVYGNTLRDLDAALRSTETQVDVHGALNTAPLTGRTPFEEVRQTLSRLEDPEEEFESRLHIIGATSMMSHGVDIDRLNVMVMQGFPLTTAEFIQTTARVGRKWPGLVYVVPKIARERDAAIFRSFEAFIKQGDRFVEPVPVTRRSRRVLERTLPGIELARLRALHEPSSGKSLATVKRFREYCEANNIGAEGELEALVRGLGFSGPLDETMIEDLERWLEGFFHNLFEPVGDMRFPEDLCPDGRAPMLSLRDVEEQAPVTGYLS